MDLNADQIIEFSTLLSQFRMWQGWRAKGLSFKTVGMKLSSCTRTRMVGVLHSCLSWFKHLGRHKSLFGSNFISQSVLEEVEKNGCTPIQSRVMFSWVTLQPFNLIYVFASHVLVLQTRPLPEHPVEWRGSSWNTLCSYAAAQFKDSSLFSFFVLLF